MDHPPGYSEIAATFQGVGCVDRYTCISHGPRYSGTADTFPGDRTGSPDPEQGPAGTLLRPGAIRRTRLRNGHVPGGPHQSFLRWERSPGS